MFRYKITSATAVFGVTLITALTLALFENYAQDLPPERNMISQCPACSNGAVDSLPISEKEFFRMKVWQNGNLVLEFGEEMLQDRRPRS